MKTSLRRLLLVFSFMVSLSGLFVFAPKTYAATVKCYEETQNITTKVKLIEILPWDCTYANQQSYGYSVAGLPNPLVDGCYFWPHSEDNTSPPQKVDCNEERFKNPQSIGSNTAKPPDLNLSKTAPTPQTITNDTRDGIADCDGKANPQACLVNNPIIKDIKIIINILSMMVGVIVTIVIIIGGIQYSAAGGNPNATTAAKKRITNAIIAFVAYFFIFAILQWLIPGGLL